jgi:hypothetical protein
MSEIPAASTHSEPGNNHSQSIPSPSGLCQEHPASSMASSSSPSWENYPKNITEYDPLDIDIDKKHQRLNKHMSSGSLVDEAETSCKIKALTISGQYSAQNQG